MSLGSFIGNSTVISLNFTVIILNIIVLYIILNFVRDSTVIILNFQTLISGTVNGLCWTSSGAKRVHSTGARVLQFPVAGGQEYHWAPDGLESWSVTGRDDSLRIRPPNPLEDIV